MKTVSLLAELQLLDTRTDENAATRQAMQQRLIESSDIIAGRAEIARAEQNLNDLRTSLRNLELQVNGLDEKIKQIEQRLYGGRVSNPKELQGLDQDERQLKKHKFDLEDQVLDLMTRIDSAEKNVQESRGTLTRNSEQWAKQAEQARTAIQGLDSSDASLEHKRQTLRKQIKPDDLRVYDDLRRSKRGRAVSLIKGTSCSACGFAVPSGLISRAKLGEELVFCVNCGRILVVQ